MKFRIEVGIVEKHVVEFSFNQLLGQLVIKVDNKEVKNATRFINEPLTETHSVVIGGGGHENLSVRFEKERKPLFGNKCRVFLNDRLLRVHEGV